MNGAENDLQYISLADWEQASPPQEIPIRTPGKVSSPQKILYQRT